MHQVLTNEKYIPIVQTEQSHVNLARESILTQYNLETNMCTTSRTAKGLFCALICDSN
jgi:hypothetical protein